MTLDDLDKLEKSATPEWRASFDPHFHRWEVYGANKSGKGHPYPKMFHGANESNSKAAAISRNILPEVIAVLIAVDSAERFASQDVSQETDLFSIIFAYREFKKKLGEQ